MKSKIKIQAFTLGELLVVMVISSIVVTLSFLALSTIQRQLRAIHATFEGQHTITQLERRLVMDLQESRQSFKRGEVLVFQGVEDTVKYKLIEKRLVRQSDTLDISLEDIKLFYRGDSIATGTFDALEISFGNTYGERGFFIYKNNDASHFINE